MRAPRINPAAPFDAAAWARTAEAHGCGVWLCVDANTLAPKSLCYQFGDEPQELWAWLRPSVAEGERREAALIEHMRRHASVNHAAENVLWCGWPARARANANT